VEMLSGAALFFQIEEEVHTLIYYTTTKRWPKPKINRIGLRVAESRSRILVLVVVCVWGGGALDLPYFPDGNWQWPLKFLKLTIIWRLTISIVNRMSYVGILFLFGDVRCEMETGNGNDYDYNELSYMTMGLYYMTMISNPRERY
jgi:hypothetical protein